MARAAGRATPRSAILRESVEGGFVYRYRSNGRRISRQSEIRRIEALAIPPAWTSVEIARSSRAKVLARGVDAAGRRQAVYHPSFQRRREREKFERLLRFGEALPRLRAGADRDLRRHRLSRARVVAGVIRLIDLQFFRVGNPEYSRRYRSYGITTLRGEHVEASEHAVTFDFAGKHGKRQRRRVADQRIARLIARLKELPGDEVFRFFDEDGVVHDLTSRHVNEYVKRRMGEEFSAKDFRTWGGTLHAATLLHEAWAAGELDSPGAAARAVKRIVREVAELLGNTPAVTRSAYIDPRVLAAAERPDVWGRLAPARARMRPRRHLAVEEQYALALLREVGRDHLVAGSTEPGQPSSPSARREAQASPSL